MKKYAVIKTISTFEHTFVVEMVEGETDPRPYADYVVMGEVEEFSQVHVDENILPNSMSVKTEDELIEMFDRENDYLASWTREQKINFFDKVSKVNAEQNDI